jgi:release factor glutamine methyltransferase
MRSREADLSSENVPLRADDSFGFARSAFRKLVHFFSFHFILNSKRTSVTEVAGLNLTVPPTVFHPKIFLTSAFFAKYLQAQDFRGMRVCEVGTGSGILALSAAKAGAQQVLALDINPAAAGAAAANARANGLAQVEARESNLFSAVRDDEMFDVIISSPPSFAGEPRNIADRAWHAGPGYRDIVALFDQASRHLTADGRMLLLVSSDTNMPLFESLMADAGLRPEQIATQSILVEKFILYDCRKAGSLGKPAA